MNKIFTFLLLLLSINTFAQNDFATIYIYRPSTFVGSMVTDHIYINSKKICELNNGGYLEYKVFTENTIAISVFGTALGTESDKLSQVSMNVSKGQIYYFKIFPQFGKIGIEQLTEPVKESKLKKKKFISLTDIGTIYENTNPDTDWTYNKLIEHWNKNGISDIEGIYERVSAQVEYRLAILKENNDYKIIYLSGARGTGWREGDIKATLRKTAQFGLFKSNWKMINKANNKDVNIVFESATMKTLSEAGDNSQDLYLKMYPTYDDDANSKIVSQNKDSWKPAGTGFFIDRNGYIATNHHVIDEAKEIQVNINNKSYLAKVVISDERSDLAILKIIDNSFIPLTSINYNFNDEISEVGNSVFALGFPLTQYMGEEIKFTDGKINAKSGFKGDISTYQISVPIQPGNSGGPLFDNNGTLVGITSSGLDKSKTDNVNYAIKTKYLKLLINEMTDKVELPKTSFAKTTLLTEKIKTLSNYVVQLKIK
jgi:S1-C subfamily serine protease